MSGIYGAKAESLQLEMFFNNSRNFDIMFEDFDVFTEAEKSRGIGDFFRNIFAKIKEFILNIIAKIKQIIRQAVNSKVVKLFNEKICVGKDKMDADIYERLVRNTVVELGGADENEEKTWLIDNDYNRKNAYYSILSKKGALFLDDPSKLFLDKNISTEMFKLFDDIFEGKSDYDSRSRYSSEEDKYIRDIPGLRNKPKDIYPKENNYNNILNKFFKYDDVDGYSIDRIKKNVQGTSLGELENYSFWEILVDEKTNVIDILQGKYLYNTEKKFNNCITQFDRVSKNVTDIYNKKYKTNDAANIYYTPMIGFLEILRNCIMYTYYIAIGQFFYLSNLFRKVFGKNLLNNKEEIE